MVFFLSLVVISDKNIAYDMSPSRKYTKLSELCVKLKRVAVIVAVLRAVVFRAVVVQAVAQPDQQVRKNMLK